MVHNRSVQITHMYNKYTQMYNRTHILCLMTVALNLNTSQFYSFNTNRNFEVLQFHSKTVLAYRVRSLYRFISNVLLLAWQRWWTLINSEPSVLPCMVTRPGEKWPIRQEGSMNWQGRNSAQGSGISVSDWLIPATFLIMRSNYLSFKSKRLTTSSFIHT